MPLVTQLEMLRGQASKRARSAHSPSDTPPTTSPSTRTRSVTDRTHSSNHRYSKRCSMDARSSAAEVPTIDLDREPAVVAVEFDAVCREVGFFQIVNHGSPTEVADAAWDAATAFFDLPLADRMSVVRPSGGYPYGYIPIAEETLTRSLGGESAPDLKEVFNVGPVDPLDRPFADAGEAEVYSPNLWPVALPQLRATWEPYYREMLNLSSRLMGLFARGLELPADYFEPYIDRSPSALRAINYPEQPNR